MSWLTQDITDHLLGNARPRSFDACMADPWWQHAFFLWWQEGANGKPMYQAVWSMYEQLQDLIGGQMSQDEFHYNWFSDASAHMELIDRSLRDALRQAIEHGEDPTPAARELLSSVTAQLEMVYRSFYEDVGVVKQRLRHEHVQDVISTSFPSL